MSHPLVAPCEYEHDGRRCERPGSYEGWYDATLCTEHERVMRRLELRATTPLADTPAPEWVCSGAVALDDGSLQALFTYREVI